MVGVVWWWWCWRNLDWFCGLARGWLCEFGMRGRNFWDVSVWYRWRETCLWQQVCGVVIWCGFLDFLDFLDFLEFLEEVEVFMWCRWPEVWVRVWEVVVRTLVRMLIWVVEEMMACVVEGRGGGFVTDSPGFVESSGKTSQTVHHSCSISAAMFFLSVERRSGGCGWGAYWRICWSMGEFEASSVLRWEVIVCFGNGRWDPMRKGDMRWCLQGRCGVFSVPENGLLLPQGQSKPQRCVAG